MHRLLSDGIRNVILYHDFYWMGTYSAIGHVKILLLFQLLCFDFDFDSDSDKRASTRASVGPPWIRVQSEWFLRGHGGVVRNGLGGDLMNAADTHHTSSRSYQRL